MKSAHIDVDGLSLHYREAGEGLPVLLLHGWPTSSFLWRNVMPPIAAHRRVIALDLPGFGASDKPLDRPYTLEFYRSVLDGFLGALGIDRLGLVVHDLGGPAGLYWASHNAERVERLAILNTLIYPELSWAVKAFLLGIRVPVARGVFATRWGLQKTLELGVGRRSSIRDDAVEGFCAPFAEPDAQEALLRTLGDFQGSDLQPVADWMPKIEVPVRGIYGARDWILPDIATTFARLKADIPQLEVTVLPECGHFLQEEEPERIGEMLAAFFGEEAAQGGAQAPG